MDPKIFGRYQIIRKLAGGGMGRVFLAYDPTLNRQVGLKLIDAGVDRDSIDVVAAERRGATLQDQLAKREVSGRVAQIFDVGDREGYFYIAMEYIEGEDLSELVSRGPLPPQRAVSIALDILDVLVKAHTFQTVIDDRTHRGIIHGDIKPRNIRITAAGQVKVLDFGIAKAVSMTRSITFNQFGSVPLLIAGTLADRRYGCPFRCLVRGDCALRNAHGQALLRSRGLVEARMDDPQLPHAAPGDGGTAAGFA